MQSTAFRQICQAFVLANFSVIPNEREGSHRSEWQNTRGKFLFAITQARC